MNIEEDIKNLKTYIELVIEKNYCDCNELNTICYGKYGDGSKNVAKSIENVLAVYEKEKEKNKEILSGNIESFQKYFLEEFNKKFISIDKLKEIVDECIPKKENIITRELEYTPNANANSYLTQEILSLIKEE